MNDDLLRIDDLSVSYGDLIAVRSLSMSVRKGERFCLVGESGSGKTSVAMAVARLLPDSAKIDGQILIGNQNVHELENRRLQELRRKSISVIFQDATGSLIPGSTIEKQLFRVIRHRTGITAKAEINQLTREHLTRVGLTDHHRILHSYPSQLSGGMCQRIMIAMALCVKPSLVIADEPTSALDVITQQKILELLLSLQNDLDFALLFITHDLRIAAHYSHTIGVMQNGILVESGSVNGFFSEPKNSYSHQLVSSAKMLSV